MSTSVRKLLPEDDFSAVARLVYETNSCLFPEIFNENKSLAKEVISYMIDSDTIYNMHNVFVALTDDEIIGIIIISHLPVKINISAYSDAFEKAGIAIDDSFEALMRNYYLPLEGAPEGYFISCLCVDEAYRSQGVGGALLDVILAHLDTSFDVYVDCTCENEIALELYKSCGFEHIFDFDGLNSVKYTKLIKRAQHTDVDGKDSQ